MMFTLLTFTLTIMELVFNKLAEDPGEDLEYTGALMTGVYGMWNIYIASLLFFFAPSHKQGIYEESLNNVEDREEN